MKRSNLKIFETYNLNQAKNKFFKSANTQTHDISYLTINIPWKCEAQRRPHISTRWQRRAPLIRSPLLALHPQDRILTAPTTLIKTSVVWVATQR